MNNKKVAVIGAGLAGLVTIKSCLEEGMEVQAFEKAADLGGNWKFKASGISVFRNTELTSSKYLTAFSDFPMPDRYPHFLTHQQYLEYLLSYARHFALESHISFETSVEAVEKHEDKWQVRVKQGDRTEEFQFDAVAVCTGLNEEWSFPEINNLKEFKGDLIHSSAYKDNVPFRGKKVVVIGGGESGGDILNELSQVADKVTLSLRRGVFIMPKLDRQMSLPGDYFHHRITYHFPPSLYYAIETGFQKLFSFINRRKKAWQIRQKLIDLSGGSYHQQFITKSDVFMDALAQPQVELKPAIKGFTANGIIFDDGTEVEADKVIFCSGFKVKFPFLPIASEGWDWRQLYKKIFHPDLSNIGFVGFARPNIGSMPPVTELQARYFAAVASGRVSLPPRSQMESIIAQDAAKTMQLKPLIAERVTGIVSFVPFMYELAELIGCRPVLRQLVRRPKVLWSVLFGTVAAPHFRLCGVHADPAAFDIIEREGLQPKKLKTPQEKLLFVSFQLIWGLGGLIAYPCFKIFSTFSGSAALKPELDF